ncbi:acetyl-CoA synthetase-like protein [Dentipellis sp. KUC8613]|nr:acetyl-CoA synthetase-like protein [Dentipellis sp. KUC8613]
MYAKSLYPDIPAYPGVNFHDFIFERPAARAQKDHTVFIDGLTGKKRTFRAIQERVADAATALGADDGLRVRSGEAMVGILSENSMEFPILAFALLKLAVPFALLPAYATPPEISALAKLVRVTHLFASEKLFAYARIVAKERGLADDKLFVLQGRVDNAISLPDLIDQVRAKKPPRIPTCPVKDDTLAYLAFSSGTSGLPKGVMISHRNLYYSGMQPIVIAAETLKIVTPPPLPTPEGVPVTITATPFYHAMGLHNSIFRIIANPATAIIIPRWDVNLVFDLLQKYTVTGLSMVPSMVLQLLSSPRLERESANLKAVIGFGTGAAHMPPELRDKIMNFVPNSRAFYEGYGMSECTLAAILVPFPMLFGGRFAKHRTGRTGILLPGMEARILRDDGSDAGVGEPGELYLRGGNVGLGYWENETATHETFTAGGWLRTGDRFADILKVSGSQVSPTEIEDVLLQHPERLIADCAVAGVRTAHARLADERVPRAWVVLSAAGRTRGHATVLAALDAWARGRLSKHKWLRGGYQVVDEIPRNPTGKVLRRILQERYVQSLEGADAGARAKL